MDVKRSYPMVDGVYNQNGLEVSTAKLLVTSEFIPANVLCAILKIDIDDPLFDRPWDGLFHVLPEHARAILDVLKMAMAITISDSIAFVKSLCEEDPDDIDDPDIDIQSNNKGGSSNADND